MAAGLCERRTPSGVAMRAYVRNPKMAGRISGLEVLWHKKLAKGYGWIFPCPDGVYNIGVGLATTTAPRATRAATPSPRSTCARCSSAFAPSIRPPRS